MNKHEFEEHYQSRMLQHLGPIGFKAHDKTIALRDDLNTISVIRLGGRMASPGSASHILCFRHSFLRGMDETMPASVSRSPFDYPYKLRPSLIVQRVRARVSPLAEYSPHNLNFDYDRYPFESRTSEQVDEWIDALAVTIADHFMPWVSACTPAKAASEIIARGEDAWCERLWLSDYRDWAEQI